MSDVGRGRSASFWLRLRQASVGGEASGRTFNVRPVQPMSRSIRHSWTVRRVSGSNRDVYVRALDNYMRDMLDEGSQRCRSSEADRAGN